MELLVPEWIRTLTPYPPGMPIEESPARMNTKAANGITRASPPSSGNWRV